MHFTTSCIALAATLLSSSVLAAPLTDTTAATNATLERRQEGWYQIENNCKYKIYYTKVDQTGTLIDNGCVEPHTTTYGSYTPDNDGVSLKLCRENHCAHPYQFELTVNEASQQIFYDLSAVDGDPFLSIPRGVYASDGSVQPCGAMPARRVVHTIIPRMT